MNIRDLQRDVYIAKSFIDHNLIPIISFLIQYLPRLYYMYNIRKRKREYNFSLVNDWKRFILCKFSVFIVIKQ